MAKQATPLANEILSAAPILTLGETAMTVQKGLLQAYEHGTQVWLERIQAEIALWSELTAKLATTRSYPEAVQAYTNFVSQEMELTAEDGQKLFDEYQQMAQKITKSLSNRGPGRV